MKKRGFTLIELLAVIVVLAVVALIAFPIIAGIIEKTKRSAAYRSVEGYVEAANNAAVLYDIDNNKGINVTEAKHTFTSNVDTEDFSKIKAKGTLPTYSYLDFDINKKVVTEGHFCINGYSVLYSEGTAKASETKYCEEDNTGSGSNSGGNNQNGGSYAGNVRWNPETKYYEVLYDGTWYQDRYFDPVWDGYLYRYGEYDPASFNPNMEYIVYNTNNGTVGKGIANDYIYMTIGGYNVSGYSGTWASECAFINPFNYSKGYKIKVEWQADANADANIVLSARSAVSSSATVVKSTSFSKTQGVGYLDLRDASLLNRDLYLTIKVSTSTAGNTKSTTLKIKSVQVVFE